MLLQDGLGNLEATEVFRANLNPLAAMKYNSVESGGYQGLSGPIPMTIDQIRQLHRAQPFQPFVMHLADGRQAPVHRRESMALSPSGRTVLVYQPDDSLEIVDLLLVASLEVSTAASR